jgi:hypothetical protein
LQARVEADEEHAPMSKIPVDHATPQITEPMETAEEMVTTGNDTIAKINASAAIANAPEVATNLKAWGVVLTALATNNTSKSAAKTQLSLAETAEPALMRRCRVRRNLVLGAVQSFGDGAAQAVQSLNMAVEEREPTPLAITPQNLRSMKKKVPTSAAVRWDPTPGAKGYLLQHATNPADPTTYSPQISLTAAKYYLGGQTPGATVYFRVLACDGRLVPTGQTAFTAWFAVFVTD